MKSTGNINPSIFSEAGEKSPTTLNALLKISKYIKITGLKKEEKSLISYANVNDMQTVYFHSFLRIGTENVLQKKTLKILIYYYTYINYMYIFKKILNFYICSVP